jgi:hypothetical protein
MNKDDTEEIIELINSVIDLRPVVSITPTYISFYTIMTSFIMHYDKKLFKYGEFKFKNYSFIKIYDIIDKFDKIYYPNDKVKEILDSYIREERINLLINEGIDSGISEDFDPDETLNSLKKKLNYIRD